MHHNPTPWTADPYGNYIKDNNRKFVCQFFAPISSYRNAKANSQRIIACVNAMNGVEHPEKYVKQTDIVIKSLNQDVKELKELLADLNEIWTRGEDIKPTSLLAKAVGFYLSK